MEKKDFRNPTSESNLALKYLFLVSHGRMVCDLGFTTETASSFSVKELNVGFTAQVERTEVE